MSDENGGDWFKSYLGKIGKALAILAYLLVIVTSLGFNPDFPAAYKDLDMDAKIALLGFIILGINIVILHAGFSYIYRHIKKEKLLGLQKAVRIATNYADERYQESDIKIISANLEEIGGILIYKIAGEAVLIDERTPFTIQIDLKNGNVLGFIEGQSSRDLYGVS